MAKDFVIGIANPADYLHNLTDSMPYVVGESMYSFVKFKPLGLYASKLVYNSDVVLASQREAYNLNYETMGSVIVLNWWPKHVQQALLHKAVEGIDSFKSIPTFTMNHNFLRHLETFGLGKDVCVKPTNGAGGKGVKFYDIKDPELSKYASIRYHEQRIKENHDIKDPKPLDIFTLIAQPKLNIIKEWRLIYMGDNFIWAERNRIDEKGTTKGSEDPYMFQRDYSEVYEKNVSGASDFTSLYMNIRTIASRINMSIGSSIDLALCLDENDKPYYTILEFQPQFGDTAMSWEIRDAITENFIIKVINPKLREMGLL